MELESKCFADYNVYGDSIVNFIKMGDIIEIKYITAKNSQGHIQKLNVDEYVNLETGEICNFNYCENRGENMASIRNSITKLRRLINNNFSGGKNELWITLTFGKNKIYEPNELCSLFEKFIKRLRYFLKNQIIDYIYVPEPHEKGDWHIHLLLKSNKTLYISNADLNKIWGHGFVKVNRLKDIDNIGAYVSSYLINIKEGENSKKGARLYLYPPQHKLYRCSKGIKHPEVIEMTYNEAKSYVREDKLTYKKTLHIDNLEGFSSLIHTESYNLRRK